MIVGVDSPPGTCLGDDERRCPICKRTDSRLSTEHLLTCGSIATQLKKCCDPRDLFSNDRAVLTTTLRFVYSALALLAAHSGGTTPRNRVRPTASLQQTEV